MSAPEMASPPVIPEPAPVLQKTLRRLFLTLFLRGRGARGLNKQGAPKSIGEKLGLTLLFYLLFGCMALFFLRQPIFALAVYLHAMTFVLLGMFVAASAGEILFNREEADILMHRPASPRSLLWAKIRVLVEVSLWLACGFNLVGLFVGLVSSGNWWFPIVHLVSTALEALFCTSCVVLAYQLCLRWFGRERLEGLMTIAQVIVSVAAVAAGQIAPQVIMRMDHVMKVSEVPWWLNLLPPAWFAGLDDALSGSRLLGSWMLTALAFGVTGSVVWLAFGKLAGSYATGLQALNETVSAKVRPERGRPWLDRLVNRPPLKWWVRDPVARASFLLTAAYLTRDREARLRVYPGIAPILIIPFIFLLRDHQHQNHEGIGFGVPFSGIYLGLVPLFALQLLQYSQHWQASDVFRAAPLRGPAALCHGARCAVLCLLAMPILLVVGLMVWLLGGHRSQLLLFLPGMIALPIFALVPALAGYGVPLSQPPDEVKAASRAANVIIVMVVAGVLAGLTSLAWEKGWFWWLVLVEIVVATGLNFLIRHSLEKRSWPALE